MRFLYGFFIFLIYVLLSVPFYFLDAGSSDILNNISTNAWLNIAICRGVRCLCIIIFWFV